MKHKQLVFTTLVVLALIALYIFPTEAEYKVETIVETVHIPKGLTPAQIIWLAQLMDCESGINRNAINPNDLDNTPSHGILQFKTQTFDNFTVKYGIEGELMDAEAQVAIVTYWLLNPDEITWGQQFPACVKKLGLPPS